MWQDISAPQKETFRAFGLDVEAVAVAQDRREADASFRHHGRKVLLPSGWTLRQLNDDGGAYQAFRLGLRVITSVAREADGKHWLHVSVSRPDRLPTYDDLTLVKRVFIGKERKAFQVFPAESAHVNLMAFCLHLWAPLEHDPLPDFDEGLGTI